MRFRELERLIVADGWIRCDAREIALPVPASVEEREGHDTEAWWRYSVEGRGFRAEAGGTEVVFG